MRHCTTLHENIMRFSAGGRRTGTYQAEVVNRGVRKARQGHIPVSGGQGAPLPPVVQLCQSSLRGHL